MSDVEAMNAANKLLGKKLYKVYARETVYSMKEVWAYDEDEAQKLASETGFGNEDIFDGADFEITDVEEDDET
jgi:hypothetical protein